MNAEPKSHKYFEIYSDWYIKHWFDFMPLLYVAAFVFLFMGNMEIFLLILFVAMAILIVDISKLIKSMKKAKGIE